VVGGATAGAEVARCLTERGILLAVLEQNARPYGKIEDGLPRWRARQRQKEYENFAGKLSHPLIHYIPNTAIGRDIDFRELVNEWGFHAVVLANGAWRDRALPVEGADEYVGHGLSYQNPFVMSFNHTHDQGYRGERFDILNGSIVVGGGLSSIDVAKIHTLQCTKEKLAERGIEVSIVERERKGIPATLADHGIRWEELGLEDCTIYYRRRIDDMPLTEVPENASPEREEKLRQARHRIVEKAGEKYKLRVEPLSAPDGLLVERGRLVGLRFRRTRVEQGRAVMTEETFERRATAVVASIGSVPAPIAGIEMKGDFFDFSDSVYGRLSRYPSVFSAGNVVTGKGNITASRKHATMVSEEAVAAYLGIGEGRAEAPAQVATSRESAEQLAQDVARHAGAQPRATPEHLARLLARIRARQRAVGYTRDLTSWLEKAGPPC
jgi:NADPH-dependent glutamate synthase beta subunit-like oxidoreductase